MASPILSILLLVAFPLHIIAQTHSNKTLGSSLTANDGKSSFWLSPYGVFAFGFQRIGSGGFLLAIWFDIIPEKTIVWSANGNNLAPEGSKVLLDTTGRLVLTDPQGKEMWSPTPTGSGVTYAAMLDTGNFVLVNQKNSTLWETFHEPTDTILPSQILSQGTELKSCYSERNYSKGRFLLDMQADGNLVLYVLAFPTDIRYDDYWSTNTVGSGFQLIFNQSGQIYLTAQNGTILNVLKSTMVSNGNFYQRAVLDYDGVFRQYVYPKTTNQSSARSMGWSSVASSIPADVCMAITVDNGGGACGFNSYCTLGDDQRPRCDCPEGYTYLDPENFMNGCKPNFEPQSCDEGMLKTDQFTFIDMTNTDWLRSDYEHYQIQDEDRCRQSCLNDCFCSVAIFRDGNCWKKKMPLSNGRINPSVGGKALIKVRKNNSTSRCPGDEWRKKDNGTLITIGSILLSSSAALNLLLILVTFLIWSRHRRVTVGKAGSLQPSFVMEATSMQTFTYRQLKEATDGFKEELGKGAFGAVYKGVITSSRSRSLVAVKVLNKLTDEGEKEFKTEVNIIGRTNHKNLVQLIGFCNEGQNRVLVYEFMENGSLASYLFDTPRPSWYRRAEIAGGIARGLLYLHEECSKQIIHCDIKPQNILLDNLLTAKISDFGLAKLLMTDQTRTVTGIRGTKGYLAPEWFRNMPVSVKVDVYSFGILLLELICCRKNCQLETNEEAQMVLSDWICDCYHDGRLDSIVEGDEEAQSDMKRVLRFAMTAMWCIQEDPSLRPPMKKVIQMLEGAVEVSVPPDPSSFISAI